MSSSSDGVRSGTVFLQKYRKQLPNFVSFSWVFFASIATDSKVKMSPPRVDSQRQLGPLFHYSDGFCAKIKRPVFPQTRLKRTSYPLRAPARARAHALPPFNIARDDEWEENLLAPVRV